MEANSTHTAAETPREITVSQDMRFLTINWEEGEDSVIPTEKLRLACWCAWCRTDRILGRFPACFEGIEIQLVKPLGSYAIHIAFSDGHARGIFPWSYLMDVAHGRAPPDYERDRAGSSKDLTDQNETGTAAPGSNKAKQ
jgi:DUF971 family protein